MGKVHLSFKRFPSSWKGEGISGFKQVPKLMDLPSSSSLPVTGSLNPGWLNLGWLNPGWLNLGWLNLHYWTPDDWTWVWLNLYYGGMIEPTIVCLFVGRWAWEMSIGAGPCVCSLDTFHGFLASPWVFGHQQIIRWTEPSLMLIFVEPNLISFPNSWTYHFLFFKTIFFQFCPFCNFGKVVALRYFVFSLLSSRFCSYFCSRPSFLLNKLTKVDSQKFQFLDAYHAMQESD